MGLITEQTSIKFRDNLPDKVDVLIIGGGVIGVSAALCLAENGLKVALLEKGRIAGEQSSRNWGWIRQLGRDEAELPIVTEATRLWKDMPTRIGADIGHRVEGLVYLARKDSDRVKFEAHLEVAKRHQLTLKELDRHDIENLINCRPGYWIGGLQCQSDSRAEPWIAVPAMARAAQKQGTIIRENCAVRGLDLSAGKVTGVVTEDGIVKSDAVLLAGGAWSRLFLQRHGKHFPQLSVLASVARTAPAPNIFSGGALDSSLAFRRREDGGYTLAFTDHHSFFLGRDAFASVFDFARAAWRELGKTYPKPAAPAHYPDAWSTSRNWSDDSISPFERMRVLNPTPRSGTSKILRKRMRERFPDLADIQITGSWAGMIDAMPDVVPTMDSVPGLEGLWVASGFSGHGFGIGPAAGRIMSDLIQGRATGHNLSRFRFNRFSDGTPLKLGPAI